MSRTSIARTEPLYVATSNVGKLRDFRAASEVFGVELRELPGLREIPPPPETGATFAANAQAKALAYAALCPGLPVLADDSGLEVEALGGEPGVRSARYAEDAAYAVPGGDADASNNAYLLERLRAAAAPPPWPARYRCVLAVARNGVVLGTAEGTVEGDIRPEARGTGGFGYDPLFWLPAQERTMAEVDLATKQRFSHRGRALASLLTALAR